MKKRTSYTVDTVFVLVLFAVFAITVLFVLIAGAGVYKNTQALMKERYEERTCTADKQTENDNEENNRKQMSFKHFKQRALSDFCSHKNTPFLAYSCHNAHKRKHYREKYKTYYK